MLNHCPIITAELLHPQSHQNPNNTKLQPIQIGKDEKQKLIHFKLNLLTYANIETDLFTDVVSKLIQKSYNLVQNPQLLK